MSQKVEHLKHKVEGMHIKETIDDVVKSVEDFIQGYESGHEDDHPHPHDDHSHGGEVVAHTSIPYATYKIPEPMWSGLHMVGNFVAASKLGTVPLIISAPHDGRLKSKDPVRKEGRGIADLHTMEIALGAFQEVSQSLGAPTIVAQLLHRSWVDCNRGSPYHPMAQAYDGPDGEAAYKAFHGTIADTAKAFLDKGISPLLIDVHGSGNPKLAGKVDAAYGGKTANFLPGLKKLYGDADVFMNQAPNALMKLMEEQGITVHQGRDVFGGGYTVHYLAVEKGVNTIQMEFDSQYRQKENSTEYGQRLGKALVQFLKSYPLTA